MMLFPGETELGKGLFWIVISDSKAKAPVAAKLVSQRQRFKLEMPSRSGGVGVSRTSNHLWAFWKEEKKKKGPDMSQGNRWEDCHHGRGVSLRVGT